MLAYFLFTVLALVSSGANAAAKFNVLKHLAGISPPIDSYASSSQLDPNVPRGCQVTRAAYLIRHAAIHSNHYEFITYIEPFLSKLDRTRVNWSAIPDLAFLSTWKNPIFSENRESLSNSGKVQAMTMGLEIAQRYYYLRTPNKIWAASSLRTVKSAHYFAEGLAHDSSNVTVVEVYEGREGGADTLAPYASCPAYSRSDGSEVSVEFQKIYTEPIVKRFNKMVPGFGFTSADVYAMSLICGYDTVLRGSSPFCNNSVLSINEWLGFEYTNDLRYFYNSGYGTPVSGAIGFPWLNATFKALMSNHETPDNNQDLFISFTHRGLPPMVMVAMGLFNNSAFSGANNILSTMPLNAINYQRVWKSSQIIPFLTDIGLEKMECDSLGYDKGTYYRTLVNHNPHSIPDCRNGPGESCNEKSIVEWLEKRAKIVGEFDTTCKVNYANSTNVLTIYDD